MARPRFDAALITDLRNRVIAHNTGPHKREVKLAELKKVYISAFRGAAPGVRAMDKVEQLLKAASFEDAEHPRAKDGQFASKGGASTPNAPAVPMPKTDEEHRALQASNAGYRALTSQALPTTQHEVTYGFARDVGAAALGSGVAIGLLRGRPNGIMGNALRNVGGWVGGAALSLPTAIVTHAASAGAHSLANAIRLGLKRPLKSGMDGKFARNATKHAWRAGQKAGSMAGGGAYRAASLTARSVLDVADSFASTKAGKLAARTAAFGAVATVPAIFANREITGTGLDPAQFGRALDAFDSRTVQKHAPDIQRIAENRSLDVLSKRVTRALTTGDMTELEKSGMFSPLIENLVPKIRGYIGAGAATLVGGAAAGGAAAVTHRLVTGRRGNPYHDAHGRFSSKEDAAAGGSHTGAWLAGAGALLGGVAAGATFALAIKRHNVRAVLSSIRTLGARIASNVERMRAPEGYGHVREQIVKHKVDIAKLRADEDAKIVQLKVDREKEIDELIRDDASHDAKLADLAHYGRSHPEFYKNAVRDAVNNKLASFLSHLDEVVLPAVDSKGVALLRDGKKYTETVAEMRGRMRHGDEAFTHMRMLVEGWTPKTHAFEAAIKNLSDGEKETARHWLGGRQGWINDVDSQIAAHRAKLDALHESSEAAKLDIADADEFARNAEAAAEREPDGPTKLTANTEAHAARATHTQKVAEHNKILANIQKLQAVKAGVISPVSGKPIDAPSKDAQQAMITEIKKAAREKHGKKFEAKLKAAEQKADTDVAAATQLGEEAIAKARLAQITNEEAKGRDLQASRIVIGEENGVTVPAHLLPLAATVKRLRSEAFDTLADHEVARRTHEDAHARLLEVQALLAKKKTIRGTKAQREAYAEARRNAFMQKPHLESAAQDAEARVAETATRHAATRKAFDDATTAFTTALGDEPTAAVGRRLPKKLTEDMLNEFNTARAKIGAPLYAFANGVTGGSVRDFADATKKHATAFGNQVKASAADAFYAAFTMRGPDGKPVFSARKALAIGGTAMGAGALEATREHYKEAKARIFGSPEERAAAKPFTTPKGFKIANPIDPLTGAGYIALHVPDGDGGRVVLWGQRYKDNEINGQSLYPGSKLSDVHARVTEANKQARAKNGGDGGGGTITRDLVDMKGLDDHLRSRVDAAIRGFNGFFDVAANGAGMQFRKNDDNTATSTASDFAKHLRSRFAKSSGGVVDAGAYHSALSALFSKQGRVLKRGEAFGLLTGVQTKSGLPEGNPIFKPNEAYKGQDHNKINEALEGEIDRIMANAAPQHDYSRGAFHLAIATVAGQKGLPTAMVNALHARITPAAADKATDKPVTPDVAAQATQPNPKPPWEGDVTQPLALPAGWSRGGLHEGAHAKAVLLGETLKLKPEMVAPAIEHLAIAAGHLYGHFDEADGVRAAHAAIKAVARGGEINRGMTRDALKAGDTAAFMSALQQASHDVAHNAPDTEANGTFGKSTILLDDFDALYKAFDEHDAHAGAQWGRRVIDGASDLPGAAAKQKLLPSGKTGNAWYNPVRMATEGGGLLASEIAANVAGNYAKRMFPGASQAATALQGAAGGAFGRTAQKFVNGITGAAKHVAGLGTREGRRGAGGALIRNGAGLAAGSVGYLGGSLATSAVAGNAYKPAPYRNAGEVVSEIGGQTVGGALAGKFAGRLAAGVAGGIAGRELGGVAGFLAGPVGAAVGATAGGYLGGVVARGAYDVGNTAYDKIARMFDSYGPHHSAKAMTRIHTAVQTAPRAPRLKPPGPPGVQAPAA